MGGSDYGPWVPLSVDEVVDVLAGAPFRWWVAGGRALELHLGRSWRPHDDLDIGIVGADAPALFQHLTGWAPSIAAGGRLSPWTGRPLVEADDENNLWWRRVPDGPWVLDVLVGRGDHADWIHRRDPTIRVPWADAVLRSVGGVPYLAPELQLLFKAKDPRPKDDLDAEAVLPHLDPSKQGWLADRLPADHPWRPLLP